MATASAMRSLTAAVHRGTEYFSRGAPMDVAYIRGTLRDFLRDAIRDISRDFIAAHAVHGDKTPTVVHYTSLQTLFSMLHGGADLRLGKPPVDPSIRLNTPTAPQTDEQTNSEPKPSGSIIETKAMSNGGAVAPTDRRYLRLYDCANLNDPLEGLYFLRELVGTQDTLDVLEYVAQVPAYITSFVTPQTYTNSTFPDQLTRKSNTRDNLVFWRHYAQEGRGCSIAIPVGRFSPDQCAAVLQRVIYGPDAAIRNARRLQPVLSCLGHIAQSARKDRLAVVRRQVAATLLECLGGLPYLYKSSAYSYEEECRIVAMESDLEEHGEILYDFETRPTGAGRLRMYGQHPCLRLTNLLATDTVITLGPSIPNADYVQYVIEQLLRYSFSA